MRERIVAAAVGLAQAGGLSGLSQARVAAAAGVRQSHVTYYFPSRKDLVKALVERLHQGLLEAMNATARPRAGRVPSPHDARRFLARRVGDPVFARLMLTLTIAADEDRALRRWLAARDAALQDGLRTTLHSLGMHPPEDELALLHAALVGAAVIGLQAGTARGAAEAGRLAELAFDRVAASRGPSPSVARPRAARSRVSP